jgi:hypothetical protein
MDDLQVGQYKDTARVPWMSSIVLLTNVNYYNSSSTHAQDSLHVVVVGMNKCTCVSATVVTPMFHLFQTSILFP